MGPCSVDIGCLRSSKDKTPIESHSTSVAIASGENSIAIYQPDSRSAAKSIGMRKDVKCAGYLTSHRKHAYAPLKARRLFERCCRLLVRCAVERMAHGYKIVKDTEIL